MAKVKKKDVAIIMGFLITFVRNYTKPDGLKPTFSDASSRTQFLKRAALQKHPVNKEKYVNPIRKSMLDRNDTQHKVNRLRNSGGIPKKCNLK